MAEIVDSKDLLEKSQGVHDIVASLNEGGGSHLWKVRSVTRWFRRKYILDLQDMSLRYEPTYKNSCVRRPKKKIDLSEIVDIRKGWKTDTFNKVGAKEEKKRSRRPDYKPHVEERTCFSIIYGPRKETLDLVAPNNEIADKWVGALQHLVSLHRSAEQEKSYEHWLRKQFNAADVDKNKCLNFSETMKLLKNLNISMDETRAKILFSQANTNRGSGKGGKEEVLDEDEFVTFYFRLLKRPEIEELFERYSNKEEVLTSNQLCQFLQKDQGDFESISISECEQLVEIFEQSELKQKGQMTMLGFVNLLLSPKFNIFNHKNRPVHQDMTQPLSHYFIASSHNTYLVGNQYSGDSSVEAYIDALKRGCRCVELDCWDGEENEPVVYHGYTLTTKILFKEILSDAIKPYAFVSSRYPLILSIENHCSAPYQAKMAEHLKIILGDILYLDDPDPDMEFLPSPEELEGKVLVKAKKRGKSSTTVDGRMPKPNSPTKGVDDGLLDEPPDEPPPRASMESLDDSDPESEVDDASIDYIDGIGKSPKKKGLSNDLSSVVNIIQAVHFHSFGNSRESGKCYQMSSFAEAKASKFVEEDGNNFVEYNKKQLSRIYPAGSRTGSSNFNPIPYWTAGCQIVALNYQTEDDPNYYNRALFSENGSCGYVLKPEFLRDPNIPFDPMVKVDKKKGIKLNLTIISGQHLPKAPGNSEVVDPYIEVKILGLQQDRAKFTSMVIRNNGFNPVWNEKHSFRIRCPELALIHFRVKDYSTSSTDLQLANFAMPLSAITTGYRHVHLTNLKGESLEPASLFIHIGIENCS